MTAQDVEQYLQNAAIEIGREAKKAVKGYYAGEDEANSYNEFIQFSDPQFFDEYYADETYNDTRFQVDMIGDFIYNDVDRTEILEELGKQSCFAEAVKILLAV